MYITLPVVIVYCVGENWWKSPFLPRSTLYYLGFSGVGGGLFKKQSETGLFTGPCSLYVLWDFYY